MPVLKSLNCWPCLALFVKYGGSSPLLDPPSQDDEDNIIAALKQSDRVSCVSLTVTRSLQAKLFKIKKPLCNLEDLVLLSQNSVLLTLPDTFRWGRYLRRLHLTRIIFPSFLQRLSFSRGLVDIQLHEISSMDHLPPEAFAAALSGTPQLQSLSLHFPSTADYSAVTPPLAPGKLVVLSALTRLHFRGISEYLEDLVARISAPRLRNVEITLSSRLFVWHQCDLPKLGGFIDRIEMQKHHCQADILSSRGVVSIAITQLGTSVCLKLQVICNPPSRWKMPCMGQICSHFTAILFHVEDVRIGTTGPPDPQDFSTWSPEKWLEFIRRFRGAKRFHIAGDHSTEVVRALRLSGGQREAVLPALHKLCVQEPLPHYEPMREAVVSFVLSCRLSGRFIAAEYEQLWMNEPRGTGTTYAQFKHFTLTCFEQDLLTRQRLMYSQTTSFGTSSFTFWVPLPNLGQHSCTCPEDGGRSHFRHPLA